MEITFNSPNTTRVFKNLNLETYCSIRKYAAKVIKEERDRR